MSDHCSVSRLDAIFKPSSVAVVGASTRPGTVGNDIFRNLLFNEFNGSVYPGQPEGDQRPGRPLLPRLLNVPGPVDLAVLIVPAAGCWTWSIRRSPKASRRWWSFRPASRR